MATIRVRDWTKERIEEIREAESHSSHDSVIKALLKDRELAKFAGTSAPTEQDEDKESETQPSDKEFDDLTVLAEMVSADNGVLFLWCPNCSNEIAHVGTENPISMSVFEVECQRCLSRLDQHTIVCIEIGYPIEQRTVEETLHDDLKRCVIDYWDRTIEKAANGVLDDDTDAEYLLSQFDKYLQEFDWEWPTDVPVISVEQGQSYRNEVTEERIEVIESISEKSNDLNDYRIRKHISEGENDTEVEVLEANTIMNLILSRNLYVSDQ